MDAVACFSFTADWPTWAYGANIGRDPEHCFCGVCGIHPFHRKRVTPNHLGVDVFGLEGFDPTGILGRRAPGAAMT